MDTTGLRWPDLRQRFAILSIISLALSTASLLEHIQFLLDAWRAVIAFAGQVTGIGDVLRGCAALVAWSVEWWRAIVRPPFQWLSWLIRFEVPPWAQDVFSVLFFALGRGLTRLREGLTDLWTTKGSDLAWELGILIRSVRYTLKVALILAVLFAIDLAYRYL